MCDEQTGLCKKCGRCCFLKVMTEVGPAFTDVACVHLDRATNLCRVFA
jgi:uncharacterized cysteine cluster protein YcgN (CxxCxxCC family)